MLISWELEVREETPLGKPVQNRQATALHARATEMTVYTLQPHSGPSLGSCLLDLSICNMVACASSCGRCCVKGI